MALLDEVIRDAENIPQTLSFRARQGLCTLEDEEEIIQTKNSRAAFYFVMTHANNINSKKEIEEIIIKNMIKTKSSILAVHFMQYVSRNYIELCQNIVATYANNDWIYEFAQFKEVDIEKFKIQICKLRNQSLNDFKWLRKVFPS